MLHWIHKKLLTYSFAFVATIGLLFSSLAANATHIIGGDLYYKYLGTGNKYEITFVFYRDCGASSIGFDATAVVAVYNGSGSTATLIENLHIPFTEEVSIPVTLAYPCVNPSDIPQACVSRAIFTDTVDLPPITGGYTLVYQRCCRNASIANTVSPLGIGMTAVCIITEAALTLHNSSARFRNWPDLAICKDQPLVFDHSATDADGDRLVYKIATPYLGGNNTTNIIPDPPDAPPYTPITWSAGYSQANMLGGVPLTINATTGILTATPNTTGQFVVGIVMEEYRNNVLINTSRRDFQYNVGICRPKYVASGYFPDIYCDGKTVNFINQSTGATAFAWDFGVTNSTTDTSSLFQPVYTFPDTGCYNVRLIAQPADPCRSTYTHRICLHPRTIIADFEINYQACNDTIKVLFNDNSTDPFNPVTNWTWRWDSKTSTLRNPVIILTAGTHTIELEVTSANGCKQKLSKTVTVANINAAANRTIYLCKGNSIAINPSGNPNLTYNWSPNATLDNATIYNPTANPTTTTIYSTTFTTYTLDTCSFTQNITVNVDDPFPTVLATASPIKMFEGQTATITAFSPNGVGLSWLPNPLIANTAQLSQTVQPTETTIFTATAQDNIYGCKTTDTTKVIIIKSICEAPYIYIPNAFTPNGDSENDILYVRGNAITNLHLIIYNRWGEQVFDTTDPKQGWDGTYKGAALAPDVFGYYLTVECYGGKTFKQQGNISLIR